MNKKISALQLSIRLWLSASIALSFGIAVYFSWNEPSAAIDILFVSLIVATVGSIPSFGALLLLSPLIKGIFKPHAVKLFILLLIFIVISFLYGGCASLITNVLFDEYSSVQSFLITMAECSASVLSAALIAFFIHLKYINNYFLSDIKNKIKMEEHSHLTIANKRETSQANKIWVKGLITAGLILLMLIPTVFVSNLVEERQQRQQEIKNEVSSKWAGTQNITFPYLYIPYSVAVTEPNGKISGQKKSLIILPENLNVAGSVSTEQRQRSIYTVLLYNSKLTAKGNFNIQIPGDVDTSTIDWKNCKICFGISDFKGIQQKITAKINNDSYDLSAGLPTNEIDTTGLSSSIILNADNIGKPLSFELPVKIKGSDQLHFVPLAGNSQFTLTSNWNSPSFDGNTLPSERNLNAKGFEADWNFNKANLPFNTVLKDFNFKKDDYSFGVSLLQPADQYAKTLRCVKYAILFIGLTFSLFLLLRLCRRNRCILCNMF